MTREQKALLGRVLGSALLLALAMIFAPKTGALGAAAYALPYLLAGYDVILLAARNILRGQVFDENFLMVVASMGAFAAGEFGEAGAVMTFYQAGELFQSLAVERSRRSIAALMDIKPDYANLLQGGEERRVSPEEVKPGELIVVRSGERVPLDGVVKSGFSTLDCSSLTGESQPVEAAEGDSVYSGSVSVGGVLTIEVTKEYGESTVQKILELAEDSSLYKAKTESFITRFARWYTPAVVFSAVALAVIPGLLIGPFSLWFHRALIFLVVSCPCALVISVPLTFFAGLGGASRSGVLVRGADSLEKLAFTKSAVFDKTGTLTKGEFRVVEVRAAGGVSSQQLLNWAAAAEAHSLHPLAKAIKADAPNAPAPEKFEEFPGGGVGALCGGREILCGSARFLSEKGVSLPEMPGEYAAVYLAADGVYRGCLLLEDTIKPGAKQALEEMRREGVRNLVMLTGDREESASAVARAVGIDRVCARLLPDGKARVLREMLENRRKGETLVFAGDGVNDAPSLAMADVGIAMGALGSDAAVEAADVVIMDDDLRKVPRAIAIARKTMSIARQNIVLSVGIKLLVMVLGALGLAGMWSAVFADVGVMVLAALNATRALLPPRR